MLTKNSFKWGIYLGITVSIGTQILTWLGLGLTNWFVVLNYLTAMLFVFLCLRSIKRHEGVLTFLKAALAVIVLILLSRLIFQSYMFVYTNYIDPNWVDSVATTWTQSLQEANIPKDLIEEQISRFRKLYEPLQMFTTGLILYAIPQLIIGLIISAVFVFSPINRSEQT